MEQGYGQPCEPSAMPGPSWGAQGSHGMHQMQHGLPPQHMQQPGWGRGMPPTARGGRMGSMGRGPRAPPPLPAKPAKPAPPPPVVRLKPDGTPMTKQERKREKDKEKAEKKLAKLEAEPLVMRPITPEERAEGARWREDRKKHYPTAAVVDKKQREARERAQRGELSPEALNRRRTLQEVLRKQRAMGLDRAAGTSDMILDSPGMGRGYGRGFDQGRGRGARGGRGGRFDGGRFPDARHAEWQPAENQQAGQDAGMEAPPTLLQKLLAKDIRRDRSHLLQCLRFLVDNNYLLDLGKKPLVFPLPPAQDSGPLAEIAALAQEALQQATDSDSDNENDMGEEEHADASEQPQGPAISVPVVQS
ncbi:hypothetical protein WJX72_000809 [[Myrmecia] bisecta]|uniref:FMR1-interacting protein 1 conserved domain-containing protein n=1 Tax=[Myrmecia] bisecta TaxID=41462 RepID=A0AAW1Q044_9CHLO